MALPDFLLKKGGAFFIPALNYPLHLRYIYHRLSYPAKILPSIFILLLINHFFSSDIYSQTADKTRNNTHQRILRVVSCAPSITEMICELDAEKNLVGITNLCNYPPEKLKDIPRIGAIGSFSAEKIISLHPDVVFAINPQSERSLLTLRKAGIKVIQIDPQSIQEIKNSILFLGGLLGKKQKARDITAEIDGIIDKIKLNASGTKFLKIYIEIYYSPPWTASSSTFIGEIVEMMGFENIFAHQYKINTARKNYFPVTIEEIISRQPDAILVLSGDKKISKRKGFKNLPAIKNNFIIIPETTQREALVRATPRMLKEYLRLQETQIIPHIKKQTAQ